MKELLEYIPLLASAIAVTAVLSGLWQFTNTTRLNREAKAVDLFLKFNEMNEQLARANAAQDREAAFWRRNALVAITEAVFRLTEGDASWDATVNWMLESQVSFLTEGPINGASYTAKFLDRMRHVIPGLTCKGDDIPAS